VEPGQMKLCYVVQGTIEILYNGKTYRMKAGDSAYLDGGVDHRWANPGARPAKVLWIITNH
jgi:quercetin dioxygenase-like cupin family protein